MLTVERSLPYHLQAVVDLKGHDVDLFLSFEIDAGERYEEGTGGFERECRKMLEGLQESKRD